MIMQLTWDDIRAMVEDTYIVEGKKLDYLEYNRDNRLIECYFTKGEDTQNGIRKSMCDL